MKQPIISRTISPEENDLSLNIEIEIYDPLDIQYKVDKVELLFDSKGSLNLTKLYKLYQDFNSFVNNIVEGYIETNIADLVYELRNKDNEL